MTISTASLPSFTLAQEASAAEAAVGTLAKEENLRQLAGLGAATEAPHVAEHVRGLVAATMAHLSADASPVTRAHAEHWQTWALALLAAESSAM